MLKKEDVTIEGNKIEIRKTFNVYALDKVQEALDKMEEKDEWSGSVEFDWSELQYIRRLLVADEVSMQMAGYNIKQSIERRKNKKETE